MDTHSKEIIRLARTKLKPAGFLQKGRSRTFLRDEGIWVCVVEFQPHSRARGSFLNVAAHWLWSAENHVSFDLGAGPDRKIREGEFVSASDSEFCLEVAEMVERAEQCADNLRSELTGIKQIAKVLVARTEACTSDCWPAYNAAIASGIAGDVETSTRLFMSVVDGPMDTPWQQERQKDCRKLIALLQSPADFFGEIQKRVASKRANLKLSTLDLTTI